MTPEGVLEVIRRRDERDKSRDAAPMKPAPDAIVLDTTRLDAEQAFRRVVALIEERRAGRKQG